MDINIALRPEAVDLLGCDETSPPAKREILAHTARLFAAVYDIDGDAVLEGLEEREALDSTGFGKGIAIPHCRSNEVKRPTLVVVRLEHPCNFEAADAIAVRLVFGLVSPENAGSTHLHALAAISRIMRDDAMIQALLDADDREAIYALLTNQILRDAA